MLLCSLFWLCLAHDLWIPFDTLISMHFLLALCPSHHFLLGWFICLPFPLPPEHPHSRPMSWSASFHLLLLSQFCLLASEQFLIFPPLLWSLPGLGVACWIRGQQKLIGFFNPSQVACEAPKVSLLNVPHTPADLSVVSDLIGPSALV